MQTMAPPDEISKERLARIDERFDEVNRRITEGRDETRALREGMTSLHATVQRGNYTLLAAMLGVIAAIVTKGG